MIGVADSSLGYFNVGAAKGMVCMYVTAADLVSVKHGANTKLCVERRANNRKCKTSSRVVLVGIPVDNKGDNDAKSDFLASGMT